MRNKVTLLIAFFLFAMRFTPQAFAFDPLSAPSATLATATVSAKQVQDNRGKVLAAYLTSKDSPLASSADTIVKQADQNGIDWKLLPSIAGVESSYCLAIPANSYNCYGYGIYGNQVRYFSSWDNGVATVSGALRTDYVAKGAITVDQIGHMYAASPTWAVRVEANMDDLEQFSTKFATDTLPISL